MNGEVFPSCGARSGRRRHDCTGELWVLERDPDDAAATVTPSVHNLVPGTGTMCKGVARRVPFQPERLVATSVYVRVRRRRTSVQCRLAFVTFHSRSGWCSSSSIVTFTEPGLRAYVLLRGRLTYFIDRAYEFNKHCGD
ncbi:hypothetical protein PR202_gb12300 [Eleusine coracana subsp. coracana]|uniref:Senescence-associated protein n=1 Tax=Eleusine coracana subsp. coracana TaxID=191504 RepID=A0AAV5EMG4_ELECO|nr:hypothetical protein PR202_gb12300 [Eleusine coracana subsp. coracana]